MKRWERKWKEARAAAGRQRKSEAAWRLLEIQALKALIEMHHWRNERARARRKVWVVDAAPAS